MSDAGRADTDREGESRVLTFKVGDLVEVLSEQEILATLDERGETESLPFMPEMVRFCGQRLTVHKVAHKLCDTINRNGLRKMERAVHLTGSRCDGSGHHGCETACSLYWKEAWLKRVKPSDPVAAAAPSPALHDLLRRNAQKAPAPDGGERFSCQATELLRAAPVCLPLKDLSQYPMDIRTGNATVVEVAKAILVGLFNRYQDFSRKALPRALWIREGLRWGWIKGCAGTSTPTATLGLQVGELVRVKSREEILPTLNGDALNRGMGFDAEMSRHCGRTARVHARVNRVIDERTGQMLTMKNPCIILENLYCEGAYNRNCPREFVPFWREIWLERIGDGRSGES
jgi:hypothetical protein